MHLYVYVYVYVCVCVCACVCVVAFADNPMLGFVATQTRFVWNTFLLQSVMRQVGRGADSVPDHCDWIVPVIHGFFRQQTLHLEQVRGTTRAWCRLCLFRVFFAWLWLEFVCVPLTYGRYAVVSGDGGGRRLRVVLHLTHQSGRVDITILSRRSRFFAGTRYLRRGVNADGDVANEVETEQIVWRPDLGCRYGQGRISSVVQLRGSIPIVWSHTNLSHPKPDIVVEPPTPGVPYARRHFAGLAQRYSLPIVCLSLIKVRAVCGGCDGCAWGRSVCGLGVCGLCCVFAFVGVRCVVVCVALVAHTHVHHDSTDKRPKNKKMKQSSKQKRNARSRSSPLDSSTSSGS